MKGKLEKYLFRKEHYTYAVLDGASVTDLPLKLYDFNATNICLYQGELPDDLAYVAPYLVHIPEGAPFTDWVLSECWGKHWGIFAQSQLSMNAMRKHFRLLLTVYDETGRPMLFRYYDPRVLPTFLKTANHEELDLMFDKVKYYFSETPEKNQLTRFSYRDGRMKKVELKLEEA